jgi:phage recombination protein Bet
MAAASEFKTAKQLSDEQGLAVRIAHEMQLAPVYVEVLKANTCSGFSDAELAFFLARCARRNLDPFEDVAAWKNEMGKITMQVRIDKLRSLARSSGQFKGIEVGLLTHSETEEREGKKPLVHDVVHGAKATVWRGDVERPFTVEVLLKEFRKPGRAWDQMPEVMVKKVAEAHALRQAFPEELAGLYISEELGATERSTD